jgi:energy-coupling factor transporter ATP-binding protein EcfA2
MTDFKSITESLKLEVGPERGNATRLVIARIGGVEIYGARNVINVYRRDVRRDFAKTLAGLLKVGADELDDFVAYCETELVKAAEAADAEVRRLQTAEAAPVPKTVLEQAAEALNATPPDVRAEAEQILKAGAVLSELIKTVKLLGVAGEEDICRLLYLTITSRLLPRPLYTLLIGPPACGKTCLVRAVCALCPPEALYDVTDATENALYYITDELSNTVILLGERRRQITPESFDATKALRELVETQSVSKLVPIKTGDAIITRRLEVKGPAAVIETASHEYISDEDKSRAILCFPNVGEEQTRAVLEAEASTNGEITPATKRRIEVFWAVQRLLRPIEVGIPYAEKLAAAFPAKKLQARRVFPRFLTLIRSAALLKQFVPGRRIRDGVLIAEPEDYAIARELLGPWLNMELGLGLSENERKLFETLKQSGKRCFTLVDAAKLSGCSTKSVRRWLQKLVTVGLLTKTDEANMYGRGKPRALYGFTGEELDEAIALPVPEAFLHD